MNPDTAQQPVEKDPFQFSTDSLDGNGIPRAGLPIDIPEDIRNWVIDQLPKSPIKTVRMSWDYTRWQTGAVTFDLDLFALPNYCEIRSAWMNVTTAFTGPATVTMSVGPDGTETTLLTAQDVKTTGLKLTAGTDFTTNRAIYSTTAKKTIQARATGATNLSNLTAGVIEFGFEYIEY